MNSVKQQIMRGLIRMGYIRALKQRSRHYVTFQRSDGEPLVKGGRARFLFVSEQGNLRAGPSLRESWYITGRARDNVLRNGTRDAC